MSDDDFDPDEHCRHCSPDCPTCGATWRRDQLLSTGRPN